MISITSIIYKIAKKSRGIYKVNSAISKKAKVNSGSEIVNSTIDDYSYCGYDCKILYTKIGKYCSIASKVTIGGAMHPLDWVSTSPVFIKGKNTLNINYAYNEFEAYKQTIIGNDVWIGENVNIKSGITIGSGAVIGMGSVVTHDVSPYSIVAGNPAKEIRKRFDEETIDKLIKSEWWNFTSDKVCDNSGYFCNVEQFIKNIK